MEPTSSVSVRRRAAANLTVGESVVLAANSSMIGEHRVSLGMFLDLSSRKAYTSWYSTLALACSQEWRRRDRLQRRSMKSESAPRDHIDRQAYYCKLAALFLACVSQMLHICLLISCVDVLLAIDRVLNHHNLQHIPHPKSECFLHLHLDACPMNRQEPTMKNWHKYALIGAVVLASAEVLDLGQMDQYTPRIVSGFQVYLECNQC